jgi:hypothetical protein
MATQQRPFRNFKAIAGAALAVLGMFLLYQNGAGAVAHLSQVLANGSRVLGVIPAFVLAVSQAVHTYSFYHQRFLQGLFQQLLVSSWPLLLVIFGAVLSTESSTDKPTSCPRDSPKFDL